MNLLEQLQALEKDYDQNVGGIARKQARARRLTETWRLYTGELTSTHDEYLTNKGWTDFHEAWAVKLNLVVFIEKSIREFGYEGCLSLEGICSSDSPVICDFCSSPDSKYWDEHGGSGL